MSNLFQQLEKKLTNLEKKRIVFPESTDERILNAVHRLKKDGVIEPILIGNDEKVKAEQKRLGLEPGLCTVVDPHHYADIDKMIQTFVERRNGRVSEDESKIVMQDANYFGTMLVYIGEADGLVSGAAHSTSDTVRPALQIIKTAPGINKTSGMFVMTRRDERYIFADCAINIAPSSEDLAEIAITSAASAKLFDVDPKIAMLSFSTKGSATSEETERVKAAVELAKEKDDTLSIDGELQFDAAFVPQVAKKKANHSTVAGEANTFIFPSLDAGNIGYKIAERLGGFEAVGPILQGLNKPVNDLSRGCSEEDVYKLALITASQA